MGWKVGRSKVRREGQPECGRPKTQATMWFSNSALWRTHHWNDAESFMLSQCAVDMHTQRVHSKYAHAHASEARGACVHP